MILRGHRVSKGKASGEAMVSKLPISFFGGVDPATGIINDKDNELNGLSVTGKILIFPVGKGSSGGSYRLYEMMRSSTAPAGMINLHAEPVIAVGAIFSGIPMVDKLDRNPLELIKSGDYVELDADAGMVKVISSKRIGPIEGGAK